MWFCSRERLFSRILIPGFPISHRRARRSVWGKQPPLYGNRPAGVGVGERVEGILSFCRLFPGIADGLSDWVRLEGRNFPPVGVWAPGPSGSRIGGHLGFRVWKTDPLGLE